MIDDNTLKGANLNGFIDGMCDHNYEPESYGKLHSQLYIAYRSGYLEGRISRRVHIVIELSKKSTSLLISLANASYSWAGTPMYEGDKCDNGNLSDLKKKGLIDTFENDGNIFVEFTGMGKQLCDQLNHPWGE